MTSGRLLLAFLLLANASPGTAALTIAETPPGFPLATPDRAAPIFVAPDDARVVSIAANALGDDLALVTGQRPTISTKPPTGENIVVLGTLGHNAFIDQLASAGKLDVRPIAGKWESSLVATVEAPAPGVARALVIVGSDRRGTAYGAFAVSEACGVSPWVWWADVTPRKRPALYVGTTPFVQGPPAVKYRGIFLNDEDWGLQPWAAKTFEPETKDIGPKTYARIFELLLRLRGNCIWPAMHPSTHAFNFYPKNKEVADDYAIVMGSSHPEPLLRNNVGEWNDQTMGPWDYFKNQAAIDRYWEQRVTENARFENLWTIGMRGEHDSAMEGHHSTPELVAKLEEIFANQRQLLAKHVNPDVTKVPQIFVPYKEVLGLYRAGLTVPDDVTLVWVDDNHGYIRQLSTPEEQKRSGGAGVYYHLSYWGKPADYLWLSTTRPALIWEEMTKAYDHGARQVWIVNVGDIKPAEIGMEFFLRLAWNPEAFRNFNQQAYLTQWAAKTFGPTPARAIGDILNRYYQLNAIKPEYLDPAHSGFPPAEADARLKKFAALMTDADKLAASIPADLRDAYFELVLYPVRGSALMNQKILLAERSRRDTEAQNATADAAAAKAAYDQIQRETETYNTRIAGGKWRFMMSSHPRDLTVFQLPKLGDGRSPEPTSAESPAPIAFEAEAFTKATQTAAGQWKTIPDLGVSGAAVVATAPPNAPALTPANLAAGAPTLGYDFEFPATGPVTVRAFCLPTHRLDADHRLRYAAAIDGGKPQIVDLETEEFSKPWAVNVLRGTAIGESHHEIKRPGRHTLTVWMLDPGVALDRIEIRGATPGHIPLPTIAPAR
jgi:hypothetical protein